MSVRGECTRVTATLDLASVSAQLNVLEGSLRNLTYSSELLGVEESLGPNPNPNPNPTS